MDEKTKEFIEKYRDLLMSFATLSDVTIGKEIPNPKVASPTCVFIGGDSKVINIEISLEDMTVIMESGYAKRITQLEKRLSELSEQMEQTQKKLSDPEFIAKAPQDVLDKTNKKHEDCRLEHEKVSQELDRLKKMCAGGR